ncbi:L-threonylcarbamoyladenylate synthase [Reinekea marinisedimentorum]|uniref:Threonylcarbamoyl-AMP synthase n=1 Tax=Reinekea marinisedimentorum TaxID=230495 RepID=A0A4R3IBP3_9GAMM|nr:L-threonylcarbamoyladenylate synthase [Reinekea marinisedimentorum]TCS43891.1 L-threonylcarbamoyladenylate synthase [Reinekea marinisedimentorum]
MKPFSLTLKRAAATVFSGGVIAYPTEGVFGLGCDPFNADAVGRILDIKKRPVHKGLILIGASLECFKPYIAELSSEQEQRLNESWPGATTWVVPHNGKLPGWVTGNRSSVAIRVPGHPTALALCSELNMPLVSTSANRSGCKPIETALQARIQLGNELDHIVSGNVLTPGKSSQIKDLITNVQYRS